MEDASELTQRGKEPSPPDEGARQNKRPSLLDGLKRLPPLRGKKNPYELKDKHINRSNAYKVLGKKRPKFETSDSLSDAAKSLSPLKKKGEKRVRSTRVGSGSVQKKRGSPPVWPHSRDHELEKMLRGTRKATDSVCDDEHHEHADRRHAPSKISEEETRESRRAAVVDRLSTTRSFLLWKRTTRMISPRDTVCLLYTSPSPRDRYISRMPSSA